MTTIKNVKIQNDLSKDRDELKAKLRAARLHMRNQRKVRDDAKLNKKASAFIKAKKQVIAMKDKIHATKINLKRTVKELSNAHAKILKSKLTLQKVTGKKAEPSRRKPHDHARLVAQINIIERRRKKIFELQNRLAKNTVIMDYAQSQKGKKAGALELHLTKRIDRLSKRLARKQKEFMNVLKRKHRTKPHFKMYYKKMADRAYKLAKADEPKEMTKKQKVHVLNLKKKVNQMQEQHTKLVAKKQAIRLKVHMEKKKLAAKKAEKKADKKAKPANKTPANKKQSAKAKKIANQKAFKLHLAKLKRKSAKEHRHNLRQQDRKVMAKIHKMNAQILRISGVKNVRPSVLAQQPRWKIAEKQKHMQNKIKRAEKDIKKAASKLKKARAGNNKKAAIKQEKKLKKKSLILMKRTARLANFKLKKLKNPKVKADAKLKKKAIAKKNKYKN